MNRGLLDPRPDRQSRQGERSDAHNPGAALGRTPEGVPVAGERQCAQLLQVAGDASVEMLWESVNAVDALKKRFGFRSAASAAEWVSETVATNWAMTVDDCERVVISAWNAMAWVVAGQRSLIVKWSAVPHLFARLRDAAAITEWLEGRGVPVALPIRARDGRSLVEIANRARGPVRSRLPLPGSRFLIGVMPVLDGDLLDVDDETQVEHAGEMLAAVHEAMAAYPGSVGGGRPGEGQQLVHNDFRSANILHDHERVTGVLDLEEVKYDNRVADVAKATVLLGCRYRDWGPTSVETRDTFVEAYCRRLPLDPEQRRDLNERIAVGLTEKGWV